MQKVSKSFFLGSIAIGLGLADVLVIIANIILKTGSPKDSLTFSGMSFLPMIYGAVVMLVLWYKSWAAIQDGHARTTPGKAIGFLFIPFFNFYWAFQAVWGLSKDFNAYLERHAVSSNRLPEGLFLAFCILSLTTWIPILGLLLLIVNFIIGLVIVSALCDAINTVAAKPPQQ
jgi:hypothetical protein